MKKTTLFLAMLTVVASLCAKTDSRGVSAAKDVVMRFCGDTKINVDFKYEATPGQPCDQFTTSVDANGKLLVKGNSPVAMCRGFYDYIRSNGYGISAWSGNRLSVPAKLPKQSAKTVKSPFRHHYYYNVVTYGYTNPYWDWKRWEEEIDWMVLHGIDMPLALVASEAIAARVWKKLGITDEEIQNYLVGPAHLPWFRMGNLSGIDNPMPASWHKDQLALQHKILDRMRALGMKPICPGFAGFLPPEIKRIYPNANVVESEWAGFHNWMLMADDPLFPKIGKMYIEEWEKEFGKCEYYIADSFNEMSIPFPPKGTKERYDKLTQYGRTVYEGIRSANPDATWVMQGWMLGYTRSIWDYESYSALMKEVPDNKIIILDMAEDYNYKFWHNGSNWDFFKGFDNKQWVYSTIPNMGGKTGMTGYLEFYANGGRLEALTSPNRGNLVGYGTAPEGTENNEVVYEIICDAGWTADKIDLKQWLENYTRCRYGKTDPSITAYWDEITQSVYNNFTDHPRFVWQLRPGRAPKGTYQIDSLFFTAIEKFAEAAPRMKNNPQYEADLIELAAQYAGGKLEVLTQNVIQATLWDEAIKVDSIAKLFTEIGMRADQVLAAHPIYNLQRWIDFARSHATTPEEATYYEKNAKRLVTIWGPPVNDYSARIWSGLLRDFYIPRMNAYFTSLQTGKPFDYPEWEGNWVVNSKGLSPVSVPKDRIAACLELINVAKPVGFKATAVTTERELGAWTPSMIAVEDWKEVQWSMPVADLKGLKGVSFRWVRGSEKLEIKKVELIVDGEVVATDDHYGETGVRSTNNDYRFELPEQLGGNNGVVLRASVRTTNTGESFGKVVMIHK